MNKEDRPKKVEIIRHSASHILAMAIIKMFPSAKLAIGPAIENGFYYDFDLPRTLIPEDLEILEKEMVKIVEQNYPFEHKRVSAQEAKDLFKKINQNYKIELIDELIKQGEREVDLYKSGNLVDLCTGPHLESTGEIPIQAIKLTKVSGAYWRGDEHRDQLQRIYGVAFANKKDLRVYLKNQEEAEKRDHRKLGKELDLFCFSDLVGPGLPLFTPKGTAIKEQLQKRVENICQNYGFEKVITPHLAKIDLYKISGHADKFSEELFHVNSRHSQTYVMKPVQCPHQTQIYASRPRSYRDLPIRYMESEKQYRAEKPGEINGLSRVIAITVEDGHSFCRIDQVKEEIRIMINIIKSFYSDLGLWGNHWVSLSVRDYNHPEKYIGDQKDWDKCESMLEEIANEMDLKAKKCEGEAALYGPKLDFMFRDAMGREIQIPTVQLDFATPKRFNLSYIDQNGEKTPPVMVHRAILGSYERMMALLIEHFAGKFPTWLAPVQASIIPVGEKFNSYGKEVFKQLKKAGIRTEIDNSNNSLGKKIAENTKQKIPYLLVIGEKEETTGSVAIRKRDSKEQQIITIQEFIDKIQKEN